jgi:NAD(P)-dependent dehydrogenase (short-subunit alcohol dehydrogenase family)
MNDLTNYLVFGASGSIGAACVENLQLIGKITGGSRDIEELERQIDSISRFDGVIWAQGINATDSAETFQIDAFEKVMESNVTFILRSLKVLLDAGKIQANSQLVVVSSVWSQLSRPNKMSYGISKAAVGGLVRSMAVDLGPLGIQVNAVSPGPIDTSMTITNLKPEELKRVISESPLKRLVNLSEVASVVCGLVTGKLSGVTGQEIVIDSGWSVSKLV